MLEVKELSVQFSHHTHIIKAVDGVSFNIAPKTIVGLVGESGSGKSMTAASLLNLLPANARTTGQVVWQGQNVLTMSSSELRHLRGGQIGLIFQNPLAALNPVFTIGNQLIETICLHHAVTKKEAQDMAIDLITKVQIPDAALRLNQYPHEFSLGMCQRLMIALTLAMRPKLLIADEPTASLDVTVQAQILELLHQLKEEFEMSILLISHDLGVIAQNCDEILVMYLGKIIEKGHPHDIFQNPLHPYTQALIAAIPSPFQKRHVEARVLTGDIPSPLNLPTGCRFHPRCAQALELCKSQEPCLKPVQTREVSCHLY